MTFSICLLSDTPWGDFPTWLQAGCAMITLMLVIMGLLQNRRIQELVDIVKELSRQTTELKVQSEILTKRYDLERKLSLKDRVPYFQKSLFMKVTPDIYGLTLVNAGVDATNVRLQNEVFDDSVIAGITVMSGPPDVKKSMKLKIDVHSKYQCEDQLPIDFAFELIFLNDFGIEFTQTVKGVDGIVSITPPEDLE